MGAVIGLCFLREIMLGSEGRLRRDRARRVAEAVARQDAALKQKRIETGAAMEKLAIEMEPVWAKQRAAEEKRREAEWKRREAEERRTLVEERQRAEREAIERAKTQERERVENSLVFRFEEVWSDGVNTHVSGVLRNRSLTARFPQVTVRAVFLNVGKEVAARSVSLFGVAQREDRAFDILFPGAIQYTHRRLEKTPGRFDVLPAGSGTPRSPLVVVERFERGDKYPGEKFWVWGRVRNISSDRVTSGSCQVAVFSRRRNEGDLRGVMSCELSPSNIAPGGTASFRVSMPKLLTYERSKWSIQLTCKRKSRSAGAGTDGEWVSTGYMGDAHSGWARQSGDRPSPEESGLARLSPTQRELLRKTRVFVSEDGANYHTRESCASGDKAALSYVESLKASQSNWERAHDRGRADSPQTEPRGVPQPLTLLEAAELFPPCGCTGVYTSASGRYHTSSSCGGADPDRERLLDVLAAGYSPCTSCTGP